MRSADCIEVLVDSDCAEQQFLQFIASAAGGQADTLWRFDSFLGHHVAKRDWKAEWTTRTDWRDDGYVLVVCVPFESLGATPEPGDTWRVNVIARSYAGQEKPRIASWSSPEKAHEKPQCFGAVVFE